MDDLEYYGSFEEQWFDHRKKLQKAEESDWRYQKSKSRDFSGNEPEDEDYEVWREPY